jgi:quercetin dioxygenase-like cupin family protein
MDYYLQSLITIGFENKVTSEMESYGICRVPSETGCVEFVKLYANISYQPHIHDKASATFIFLSGTGKVVLDGIDYPYKKGSIYSAVAGVKHGFVQDEETIFLSIQSNPIQDRTTGDIDIRY